MTDDDEECQGEECDDAWCDQREEYEVTFTWTATGIVRAHSKDEAESLANDILYEIEVEVPPVPGEWEDLEDGDVEHFVENVREVEAERRRWQEEAARLLQAEQPTP